MKGLLLFIGAAVAALVADAAVSSRSYVQRGLAAQYDGINNASQTPSLVIDIDGAETAAELFDTFGNAVGRQMLKGGLNRIAVPVGGYAKLHERALMKQNTKEHLKTPHF